MLMRQTGIRCLMFMYIIDREMLSGSLRVTARLMCVTGVVDVTNGLSSSKSLKSLPVKLSLALPFVKPLKLLV